MLKGVSPEDKVRVFPILPDQPWLVDWDHQTEGQCLLGPAVAPDALRRVLFGPDHSFWHHG